jgi:hypothetical protein
MEVSHRIIFKAITAFFFLGTLVSGAGFSYSQAKAAPKPMTIPAGWTLFRGSGGVVVLHPKGWQVQDRGSGSFIAYRTGDDGGARAVVLVEPIPKIEGRASGVVAAIGRIYPELFPDVNMKNVRKVSEDPDVATGSMAYTAGGTSFRGQAMCFRHQQHGVLYAMASTAATWSRDAPVMKRILQNFFYAGSAPSQSAQKVSLPQMVNWRDPIENAFTCPVPSGWKAEGGLRRFSAIDVRPELLVTSPDGKIVIRIGDASVPPMFLPSQPLQNFGIYEGGWYSPDGINKLFVMRYLPGTEFLTAMYLPQRVGDVSHLRSRDFPDLSQQAQMLWRRAGVAARVDTNEITFDARTEEGNRKGYAFVQTAMIPAPGMPGGNWYVTRLNGYLSAPESEPVARAVLNRMVSGYRTDPNWEARQIRTTGRVSQIMSDTNNQIADMIAQTFKKRSDSQERIFGKTTRALRGDTLLQDPITGQQFEVNAGSNYYWKVEGDERFVGTDAPDSPYLPNHWLREMLPAE